MRNFSNRIYIAVAMLMLMLSTPLAGAVVELSGKISWNT
jgi:hypothetical protein